MHEGRRDDHRKGDDVDLREDGLDVGAVVARDGGRVEDDGVDWSALDVVGVSSTPDHHRPDPVDAEGLVQGVDEPDKPGGVARDDPGELLSCSLFVVRVGVEGEPGDLVFLAALKDCLLPEALIDRPVLLPDAAGSGVHDDIGGFQHRFDVAGDIKAGLLERRLLSEIGDVEGEPALFCDVRFRRDACL